MGTCWCGNREANVFADRSAAGAASGRKPRCGRRGRDAVTHRDGRGKSTPPALGPGWMLSSREPRASLPAPATQAGLPSMACGSSTLWASISAGMEPLQQVLQKAKAVALYYSGSLWALKQFVTTGRTDAETEYSQEAPGGAPFAGLINQGLTCYLNALLQCLFLTPEFRDRIQEKPWASQPEQALGQIFRGLQRRCGPVPTNALTTCLGLHGEWTLGGSGTGHQAEVEPRP
ncbi:uncharacterized protein LOC111535083 isoform X2 [Piliocolobus tephrosceles]|uniref:uncharacterized protein LOC111535083 isoform X2 n=1 Tax=Piliocolobus tephrosceles TaxID=591936 RepID=UPI000C2B5038|nr:uncharacterized protein LOC111535083 isoform X2 [Piliocolobus tephrosceles]